MHFTRFLATIAFASLALGGAIPKHANVVNQHATNTPAPAPLVAGTGPFKNIKATQAAWDHVNAACANGKKRGLESRTPPGGFMEVSQGQHKGLGSSIPFGLYTKGLVTCFGIVIKGTPPATNPDAASRWLLHMHGTKALGEWDRFKADVAKSGLTDMTGYMSLPLPTAIGTRIEPFFWTQEDQDLSNEMKEHMKSEVRTFTKKEPVVHMRPLSPPSTMQISVSGEVRAGTTVL